MKTRDTNDALTGALALVCDALAVFGGLMLATWIRLGSGWMALTRLPPPNFYSQYALGAVLATLAFLFIFHLDAPGFSGVESHGRPRTHDKVTIA